jgi:hypothetical protein
MLALAAAAGGQEPAGRETAAPEGARVRLVSVQTRELPSPLPLDPDSLAPSSRPSRLGERGASIPIVQDVAGATIEALRRVSGNEAF